MRLSRLLRAVVEKTGKGGAGASDEKYGSAALEYLYEKVHCNDPKKRAKDVAHERLLAQAHDRYASYGEKALTLRIHRLTMRMREVMQSLTRQADMAKQPALVTEACLLNSTQPPNNYRRPTLTPPLPGYEPGFGLDVSQLRTSQSEYPQLRRVNERGYTDRYPFAAADDVQQLTSAAMKQIDNVKDSIRSSAPATGTTGEAGEALIELNRKAILRQQVILDAAKGLPSDPELLNTAVTMPPDYNTIESDLTGTRDIPANDPPLHYAQEPKYQPIRSM